MSQVAVFCQQKAIEINETERMYFLSVSFQQEEETLLQV